jgi:hypothetical protein
MWGNFPMQGSVKTQTQATNFFNQNNYTVPLIAFQGIDDGIVKYDWRYERFPPSTPPSGSTRGNYDTTSFCLENCLWNVRISAIAAKAVVLIMMAVKTQIAVINL